jgi:Polyketide cyclase / dehydrase and lipid transport
MLRQITQYHLRTRWSLAAPVGAVWTELSRPEGWPQWWKGMLSVRLLEQGDGNGMGAYRRIIWRGVLPARITLNLRTVKIEPRAMIESIADGQVTGVGRWQLTRAGAGTEVQHDWIVNVGVPGIPVVDAIAGLLFKWNYRSLMKAGRRGLEGRVGVRLGAPPAT